MSKGKNKKGQQEIWDRCISDLENDIHGRQTMAYEILQHINLHIKETADVARISQECFLEFFRNVWSVKASQVADDSEEMSIAFIVDKIKYRELQEALAKLKNRKAAGSDNLKAEMFKYASEDVKRRLLRLYNVCWSRAIIPDEWSLAVICPVFKKGDRSLCKNYRRISLLNIGYKLYSKMITSRLRTIIEIMLLEEQTGFWIGRSCSDNVFSLKQLIEKYREFNIETDIIFIDYEKAFDQVNSNLLFDILRRRGLPLHLIKIIKSLYKSSKIFMTGDRSEMGITDQGVRQGSSTSPILFNV